MTNNSTNNLSDMDMEYEQLKYDFLKLLKQFKIFDFDKFMKWLEKLVFDYQRVGYNVIEHLEAEFHALNNNKKIISNHYSHHSEIMMKRQSIESENENRNQVKNEPNEQQQQQQQQQQPQHTSAIVHSQHQAPLASQPFSDLILPAQVPPPIQPPYRVFKTKINEKQVNALEAVFKQKQYLSQFEKQELSNLLHISPLQVKSWFKNRRYRQKKNETLLKAKQQEQEQIQTQQNGTHALINQETNGDENDIENNMTLDDNDYDDCSSSTDGDESHNIQVNGDDICNDGGVGDDDNVNEQDDEDDNVSTGSNEIDMLDNQQQSPTSSLSSQQQFKASFPRFSSMPSKNILYKMPPSTTHAFSITSQLSGSSMNTIRFSKAFNDELEKIFATQKYLSNSQRDYLAEKFRVPTSQITNWFQNKRRKLQRAERNKALRAKNDDESPLHSSLLNEAATAVVLNMSPNANNHSPFSVSNSINNSSHLANALLNHSLNSKTSTFK